MRIKYPLFYTLPAVLYVTGHLNQNIPVTKPDLLYDKTITFSCFKDVFR